MTNIDRLENEAMAMIYDASKPDELKENKVVKTNEIVNSSFFKISKIFSKNENEEEQFRQSCRLIKMTDCDWECHYLMLLNYKIGVLIPKKYLIIYDDLDNNLNSGKIDFRCDKDYSLEYFCATKSEFEEQIEELKIVSECVEHFVINDQIFYEFNNQIYMYYHNYIWKMSGYSRNDINEYFDMYLILMSVRSQEEHFYFDKDNFKRLYLIEKNALNYLYKGIDLKKKTSEELKEYPLTEDVVTFSIDNNRYLTVFDENYQIYQRKLKVTPNEIEKISIHHDLEWYFEGTFKAGALGTYNKGLLIDFPEIMNSGELSELEKRNLLESIINQKQVELYEYKDFITNKLLDNLFEYLKNNLTISLWNELELINYLYIEKINIENKTEELLYDYFKYCLDNNEISTIKELFDIDYLTNSVSANNIAISSEFMIFACNVFNKNKTFILFDNNEFIEWK